MSKSLGNVIEPFQVVELYGAGRAALLRAARGQLRRGRRGLARGLRDALQHRARQRVRQPRQPHAGDDRPLPRRRRARRRAAGGAASAEFDGLAEAVARAPRPGRADRGARRDLAARQARSTATSRTRSRGSSPRTRRRRSSSTRCSTRWPRACAWSSVLLHPFMPGLRRAAAGGARAARTCRSTARASARPAAARAIGELGQLFPRVEAAGALGRVTGPVVDTHCHLDHCEPPDAELVERARAAGRDAGSPRSASTAPRSSARSPPRASHEEVFAIVGRHPHETAGFGAGRPRGDRARGRRPAGARDRRDRPRLLPRLRPARRPAARLRGPARARGAARAAGGHPHARGRGRHLRDPARARRRRCRR